MTPTGELGRSARLRIAILIGALALAFATGARAQAFSLGEAATFGILALDSGTLSINSATSISGDVGYSDGVISSTNQKVTEFDGGAYLHSGATVTITDKNFLPSDGIFSGPSVDSRLNQANADAQAAASILASLAATQSFGFLGDDDSLVLNSTGDFNLIDIDGFNYNSDSLTLNSRPGFTDSFVLRINGDFDFSQSSVELNGLSSANVLFYFPNPSAITINKSSTEFFGTLFAPVGSVEYHNPATFEGSIIAEHITLHSDFNLSKTPIAPIPEPSGALCLLAAGIGSLVRRRRIPVR